MHPVIMQPSPVASLFSFSVMYTSTSELYWLNRDGESWPLPLKNMPAGSVMESRGKPAKIYKYYNKSFTTYVPPSMLRICVSVPVIVRFKGSSSNTKFTSTSMFPVATHVH